MIKVIVAIVRNPAISAERFHEHWRSTHARLVVDSSAAKRYIRRYIQCHTLPAEYAAAQPPFDGIAELWFDSVLDKDAFFGDPDYIAHVQPDESRFADMTRTRFIVTEEEAII